MSAKGSMIELFIGIAPHDRDEVQQIAKEVADAASVVLHKYEDRVPILYMVGGARAASKEEVEGRLEESAKFVAKAQESGKFEQAYVMNRDAQATIDAHKKHGGGH